MKTLLIIVLFGNFVLAGIGLDALYKLQPYKTNAIQLQVQSNHTISASCRNPEQSIDFDGNSQNITLSCN